MNWRYSKRKPKKRDEKVREGKRRKEKKRKEKERNQKRKEEKERKPKKRKEKNREKILTRTTLCLWWDFVLWIRNGKQVHGLNHSMTDNYHLWLKFFAFQILLDRGTVVGEFRETQHKYRDLSKSFPVVELKPYGFIWTKVEKNQTRTHTTVTEMN